MILSGLSQQASRLDKEKMQTQLQSVTAILETAQRDLRNSTLAFATDRIGTKESS